MFMYNYTAICTAEPSPVEAGNDEGLTQNECEDQIPHLDDILKASFVSVCIIQHTPIFDTKSFV